MRKKRKLCFIKGVASRFPVEPRNGPAINPFISGIIADERIKLVSKELACRYLRNSAEIKQTNADVRHAAIIESGNAIPAGRLEAFARIIAHTKPPA